LEIALPHYIPLLCIEAKNVTALADGEHARMIDGWCRAWTTLVPLRVRPRSITELPALFAGPGVKAPNGVLVRGVTHRVDTAITDSNRREPGAYESAPEQLRPLLAPVSGDGFLARAIAVRPTPLWPVTGLGAGHKPDCHGQRRELVAH